MPRQEYSSLRQGLVGAWCPSLGASGLSLIDRSGRGNHGVLTNMAGQDNWRASGSGVAINFDGTNDYVVGASGLGFPLGASARSLCAWFKFSANVNAEFVSYGGNALNFPRFAIFRDTTAGIGVEIGGAGQQAAWTYDTNWHHLCGTFDASATTLTAARVYLDGNVQVTTGNTTSVLNTLSTGITIGAISGTNVIYPMNGLIDDARLYNRALTLAEIRLLASRRGIGLTPLPDRAAGLPRKLSVNVGGTWRAADAYVCTATDWRLSQASVNVGGTWK